MRFAFAIAAAAAAVLVGSPSAAAVLDKHEPDEVVLAAGRRGHVAIGWTSSGRVAVAVRDPHGSIAGPWSVSDGDPVLLGLAVDGKGNLVVAWGVNDATTEGDSASAGCCRRLRVAVRPAGGRLGRPVSLSAPGADALGVLLRSTSHRTAIGWTTQPLDSSNASSVQLATAPPGRRFGAPQTLALAHPQVLLAMAFTTRRSPDFARDGSSALLDDSGRPPASRRLSSDRRL